VFSAPNAPRPPSFDCMPVSHRIARRWRDFPDLRGESDPVHARSSHQGEATYDARRRAVRESLSAPVVAVIKGEGNKPERCPVRVTSARPGAGRAQPPARSESRYRTARGDCLRQLTRHCARQKLRFSKNFWRSSQHFEAGVIGIKCGLYVLPRAQPRDRR
jgi:hypothetical protein